MQTTTYHAPPATYTDGVLYHTGDKVDYLLRTGEYRTGTVLNGSNAGFRGLEYTIRTANGITDYGIACSRMTLVNRPANSKPAIPHQNGWNPAEGGMDRPRNPTTR